MSTWRTRNQLISSKNGDKSSGLPTLPPATGKRGISGIPREAVGSPYYHHPDDCSRGSRERQGSDGRFGDVDGVSSWIGSWC